MSLCAKCIQQGYMESCKRTECSQHDSWYARELEKEISLLKAEIKILRRYRPEFMNKPLFSKE